MILRNNRRLIVAALAAMIAMPASAALACEKPDKNWSLGYVIGPNANHPTHAAGLAFKQAVEELSNCRIQVNIFAGGQLGGDREMFEALEIGTQDFGFISSMPVGTFTKAVDALNLPWLFEGDLAKLRDAVDGDAGKLMFEAVLADTGVRPLGIATTPFRHFISNRPVDRVEAVKGLKLRVMQSNLSVAAFSAIGTNPTPMAFAEVYGALETGVVDALENDVVGFHTEKLYEVAKHVTYSGHFNNPLLIVVNDDLYTGLSDEDRKVVTDAVAVASKTAFDTTEKQVDASIVELKKLGVTFYEIDTVPFRDAMTDVYADVEAQSEITKQVVDMITGRQGAAN